MSAKKPTVHFGSPTDLITLRSFLSISGQKELNKLSSKRQTLLLQTIWLMVVGQIDEVSAPDADLTPKAREILRKKIEELEQTGQFSKMVIRSEETEKKGTESQRKEREAMWFAIVATFIVFALTVLAGIYLSEGNNLYKVLKLGARIYRWFLPNDPNTQFLDDGPSQKVLEYDMYT